MLPRINRIKKKKDFEVLFKRAKSFKADFLVLKVAPNNLHQVRVGFVVSQKVSKKSVVRNKVRRRLSKIIETKIKNIKEGIDIVFIALPGGEKIDFSEMEKSINRLFKIAKIIIL